MQPGSPTHLDSAISELRKTESAIESVLMCIPHMVGTKESLFAHNKRNTHLCSVETRNASPVLKASSAQSSVETFTIMVLQYSDPISDSCNAKVIGPTRKTSLHHI